MAAMESRAVSGNVAVMVTSVATETMVNAVAAGVAVPVRIGERGQGCQDVGLARTPARTESAPAGKMNEDRTESEPRVMTQRRAVMPTRVTLMTSASASMGQRFRPPPLLPFPGIELNDQRTLSDLRRATGSSLTNTSPPDCLKGKCDTPCKHTGCQIETNRLDEW